MRAEDQSVLVADAAGMQTVQCLFIQPGKHQQAKIGNVEFEKNPDGLYAYVYAGTFDGYTSFRQIMEQHGVYPAHEIPGAASAETDEPTVQTDTGKTATDTLTNPVEIEADNALQGSEHANGGQSEAGQGSAPEGQSGSDNADGSGLVQPPAGNPGGEAEAGNSTGSVSQEVAKPAAKTTSKSAKAAKPEADPFQL